MVVPVLGTDTLRLHAAGTMGRRVVALAIRGTRHRGRLMVDRRVVARGLHLVTNDVVKVALMPVVDVSSTTWSIFLVVLTRNRRGRPTQRGLPTLTGELSTR
jgi:hypothetical protein